MMPKFIPELTLREQIGSTARARFFTVSEVKDSLDYMPGQTVTGESLAPLLAAGRLHIVVTKREHT